MQLSAGDKLGPYEIIAQIGAGGMGIVYRARDVRVHREVAVKVSAEHFNDRFEREARAVAALNHPNISALYDVGPNYLVMELVEGESPRGPLPLQTALDYARQLADALDAAHEKGIVHRDLKPGNIKVRSDGTVKVLDFGLAKIEAGAASSDNAENSPTISLQGTQAGIIMGTASYMSPEQARGKPVDRRADIWAFGAVFYEMLTGRRAFEGEDVSTIVAAVIHSQPRWEGVPASVRRLLESCLEKDPRKRLRDIGDAWKLLDSVQNAEAPRSRLGALGWIVAAALAVVVAIALWAPWRVAPAETAQPLVRLDVDLGPDVSLLPLTTPTFSSVIVSPDRKRLVFVGSVSDGSSRLFAKRLDEAGITEITGTQGALNPFFSPDGEWVAFWSGGKLAKIPLNGGARIPLADFNTMTGGSWTEKGGLLVGSGLPDTAGLVRVPIAGGTPSPVLKLATGELFYNYPQVLPGGKAVLVAVVNTPASLESTNVDVISLDDGRRTTLVRGGTSPRYLPSGHVVYARRAKLFAIPFDIDSLEALGPAVEILNDVASDPVTGGAQFDVSRDGTLVYRPNSGGSVLVTMQVQWLDRGGNRTPLLGTPREYFGRPRLSPDGRRIAITIRDGADQDIWVYDAEREGMTRLSFGGGQFTAPVWSRDGQYVIFGSMGLGTFWARADGAGQPQVLLAGKSFQFPSSLTPVGNRLAFDQVGVGLQIWTVPLEENGRELKAGTPTRLLTTQFTDAGAAFSPDGRWVAYHSDKSGKFEVYVRAFSASSGKEVERQVSSNGGLQPAWLPNGGELLYQSGGQIMTVSYPTTAESFLPDKPRVWAENARGVAGFDIAPDGKRLAINVPAITRDVPRQEHTVVFMQNFFDELRRRVPVRP